MCSLYMWLRSWNCAPANYRCIEWNCTCAASCIKNSLIGVIMQSSQTFTYCTSVSWKLSTAGQKCSLNKRQKCWYKNRWQLLHLVVNSRMYPIWVTYYEDMNSHLETPDMRSGPSVWTAQENVWQSKTDLKWEIRINHHLNIHLVRCSKAAQPQSPIAWSCLWERAMHSSGLTWSPTSAESAPFLFWTLLKSNWILDESTEEETLSGRGESGCLRKKTIKEWKAGDSTFWMSFFLKDDALWDAWQDKLSLLDF